MHDQSYILLCFHQSLLDHKLIYIQQNILSLTLKHPVYCYAYSAL